MYTVQCQQIESTYVLICTKEHKTIRYNNNYYNNNNITLCSIIQNMIFTYVC